MNKEVKELLKKVPGLRPAVKFVKNRINDTRAISAFLAERNIYRGDGPIRVGFLCQYIPAWTKVEDLYRMMQEDPRFEPYLICIPFGIHNNRLDNPESLNNDAYDYCIQHGYPEAINALVGKEKWLELKTLELSYIFYSRPYNVLLPAEYTSQQVSRYSRVCLIMYGIEISEETTQIALNREFMSHVYYYFSDFQSMQQKNIQKNWFLHKAGLQKTKCVGYPMIERIVKLQHTKSPSWDFSENSFRVLWTPRWITDPKVGGTNFFAYYKEFIEYAKNDSTVDFLVRPHPLAFSHFQEIGKMSAEEIAEYKHICDILPNVAIDQEQGYGATFWGSSVLVSDISSIMLEYFATEKPLIFCDSNMELSLASHVMRMLEGCYVVHNKEELFQCLRNLKNGEDPLLEKRVEISRELFGINKTGICERIIDELAVDAGR